MACQIMCELFDLQNTEYNLHSKTDFSLRAVYTTMIYGH